MKKYFIFLLVFVSILLYSDTLWAASAQLQWVGIGADRVGQMGNGTPDGTPDGQFRLALNSSVPMSIRSIAVFSADANGNRAGVLAWHTSNAMFWVLGVVYNGRQLNQSQVESLGNFPETAQFDLFCNNDRNDSGWFKTGQHFLVEIEFADGSLVKTTVTIGSSDGPTGKVVSAQLQWVGKDADRVGAWNCNPSGSPNGHFRLALNSAVPMSIRSIAVFSADANGNPAGGQVWHSRNRQYWVLGAFFNERQLNPSHVDNLGDFPGTVQFDLFCGDSGWFNTGQNFLVEIEFTDGSKIRTTAAVGGSGPNTGKVAIQTLNGNYLTAVSGGGRGGCWPVNTDTTQINAWEKFKLIPLGGDYYAIQTINGYYLTAVNGGGLGKASDSLPLHTDAWQILAHETFKLIPLGDGYYAIQTVNGNYLTAVNGGDMGEAPNKLPIHTDALQIDAYEKFKIISFQ